MKVEDIANIWIESEQKAAIIGGKLGSNDNSDVLVTFNDGEKYTATFFTYENIEFLRQKNKKTGECLNGKYFWASDLIIIEKLNRYEIEKIISHLIKENEFNSIFNKIRN